MIRPDLEPKAPAPDLMAKPVSLERRALAKSPEGNWAFRPTSACGLPGLSPDRCLVEESKHPCPAGSRRWAARRA